MPRCLSISLRLFAVASVATAIVSIRLCWISAMLVSLKSIFSSAPWETYILASICIWLARASYKQSLFIIFTHCLTEVNCFEPLLLELTFDWHPSVETRRLLGGSDRRVDCEHLIRHNVTLCRQHPETIIRAWVDDVQCPLVYLSHG